MEVSTFIPKLQYSYIVVLIEDVQFSLVHSQYSLRGICLSGGNYFRGRFIVSGQFSGGGGGGSFPWGQLFRWHLFLEGNCPGGQFFSEAIVRRANFLRDNCPNTLWEIVRGAIVRTPYFGSLWYQQHCNVIVEIMNIKYGLYSKYLFQRTQQHDSYTKPVGNHKFIQKIISSSYHTE